MKKALLIGLNKFGRKKTFNEILTAAGYTVDKVQRIELATELETAGLIQSVTYKLPFEIRAELSLKGRNKVNKIESGASALDLLLTLFGFGQASLADLLLGR